ncbi:MAG TPA: NAD-dependent epimerase/dehydratase family protein [Actinomycetales bacterium]|nr:NAD-dependent epimerase/dehydratase family protein [Actinomycetales bacterium]
MTTLLVLGGTAWLGGEVARAAVRRGHDVTCLARGVSGSVPEGVRWVRADRAAPDAYDAVRDTDWDDVVDVSWQPGQVRSALAALAPRARHWTYVSSCSVYADHSVRDADESTALLPALQSDRADLEQYGEAKVACEQLCRRALGDRVLLARSGVIAGYGDPSDRFGYWPGRFALARQDGGQVLVPDTEDLPTQAIDVRDLADWLVRAGEGGTAGAMNVVGERRPFRDVIAMARAVAGFDGSGTDARIVRVPSDWLLAERVDEYMGPRSLPLWLVDPEWAGFSARNGDMAVAAGLTHGPLRELVAEALRWEEQLGLDRDRRAGLSRAEENELLRRWTARR